MIGSSIQHYKVTAKLGEGGMGVVYRAHDSRLERDVAIKVLSAKLVADESAREWFRKEGRVLSKLSHPNIAVVHESDTADGMDFLVMEFVAGESLAEKLNAGPLPETQARLLGEQLASALEEAHKHGVVHRDLKPGNVMITPKGQAKVLDFGLAKLLQAPVADAATLDLSHGQNLVGTLPYMAPEQLRGQAVDARTDVHALGAVLYEMVTGRRPFEAKLSTALAADIQTKAPERPSSHQAGISAEFERIILKCLEKDPAQRYQSAELLLADLRGLGLGASANKAGVGRGWRIAVPAAAVAFLALLYGLKYGGVGNSATPAARSFDSIAVLPLRNLSGDPEQEYFSAGMHEALIQELARLRGLKVISRTSVMGYKDTRKKIPEIAQELGVDAIVDGSTVRSGNRVRIRVEVIDGKNDRHLWAESFDRNYGDILALQSEAALAIATQIRANLTPEERRAGSLTRTVNPEAHELFLKGTFAWNKFYITEEGMRLCQEYLEQAIQKDPTYAPAYAALAGCHWEGGLQGFASSQQAFPRARELAKKALELDPTLAEAHAVQAAIQFFFDWDWPNADAAFREVIRSAPNHASVHRLYGYYHVWMGKAAESIPLFSRALELDPRSASMHWSAAYGYAYAGQYEQAVRQVDRALQLDPNNSFAYSVLAGFHLRNGHTDKAVAAAQKGLALSGGSTNLKRILGQAFAASGRKREAEEILKELEQLRLQGRARPSDLAALCGSLGKRDQAFAWLDVAFKERESGLVFSKVAIAFDSLRDDARFRQFMRRMNFPE